MIYDKPLVEGNNTVCPKFLKDLKQIPEFGNLKEQQCIKNGCIYTNDTSIICPSGFWGYKHIIEQPLNLESTDQDLEFEINTNGSKPALLMGVSKNLEDFEEHKKELQSAGNLNIEFLDSKQLIGLGLQKQDLHLVYFYCHGGRKGSEVWLGVGENERILPRDLVSGWKINWPLVHPLVFINGCHTVDITPNDLVPFNRILSRCQASGVIGTEITITETLARHFANGFLRYFLSGFSVGEAIREQRLDMLKNYNLLGLAYTPYCSSDLKLINTN